MPTVGNGEDIIGQSFTRGSVNVQFIISLFTHFTWLFWVFIFFSLVVICRVGFTFEIYVKISSSFAWQDKQGWRARER